jgi:hypothetical protein
VFKKNGEYFSYSKEFNQLRIFRDIKYLEKLAMFDARVFQVPNVDEMVNTI